MAARKAKEAEEKRKKDAEAATVVLEDGSSFVDVMGTLKLNERCILDHAKPKIVSNLVSVLGKQPVLPQGFPEVTQW